MILLLVFAFACILLLWGVFVDISCWRNLHTNIWLAKVSRDDLLTFSGKNFKLSSYSSASCNLIECKRLNVNESNFLSIHTRKPSRVISSKINRLVGAFEKDI